MKNKLIIWDLFGGQNGSIEKALLKGDFENYEIYTFDILPETKDGKRNIVLDLTKNIDKLISILTNYPKPDIIVASPMCKTFSRARGLKGGNDGWLYDSLLGLRERERESFNRENSKIKRAPQTFEDMVITRNFGKKAIENTVAIIKYFKPKYWYIENPAGGYIWKYINQNLKLKGEINETYYNNYGFETKKRTIFLSNKKLHLKLDNIPASTTVDKLQRKDRSDIPENLLIDILKIFFE